MVAARIPANFFAMPFGLAGLGVVWSAMSKYDRAPRVVANALFVLAALVWLIVLIGYLRHALGDRGSVRADFTDQAASPFVSPAVITPMLLAAQGLFPVAPTVGKVLTDVFLALTVLLGSWLTSQWMYGPLDLDRFHPGYLLPTVAGGMGCVSSRRRGRSTPAGDGRVRNWPGLLAQPRDGRSSQIDVPPAVASAVAANARHRDRPRRDRHHRLLGDERRPHRFRGRGYRRLRTVHGAGPAAVRTRARQGPVHA